MLRTLGGFAVFVRAATSATPERSFSLARRLKTWLRSTMSQKRFNSLAVLLFQKEITDENFLVDVANELQPNQHAKVFLEIFLIMIRKIIFSYQKSSYN